MSLKCSQTAVRRQISQQLQEKAVKATPVHCTAELHVKPRNQTCIKNAGNDYRAARFLAIPAVAHHSRVHTPLQAPIVQPSHTSITVPLGTVDLHGVYSVQGPAVIRKVNNTLVALVQPGGAVSVLCNPEGLMVMSSASLSHDDEEAALCRIHGWHLELDGCYVFQDEREGIKHDGKTIVSVAHLSEGNCITLLPGGTVSHPINMHPHK